MDLSRKLHCICIKSQTARLRYHASHRVRRLFKAQGGHSLDFARLQYTTCVFTSQIERFSPFIANALAGSSQHQSIATTMKYLRHAKSSLSPVCVPLRPVSPGSTQYISYNKILSAECTPLSQDILPEVHCHMLARQLRRTATAPSIFSKPPTATCK